MNSFPNTGRIVSESVGEYGELLALVRLDRPVSRPEMGGTLTVRSVVVTPDVPAALEGRSLVGLPISLPGDDDLFS
jgi:hypothetical protein